MFLLIAQEIIWQGMEHAVPISFHWMKLAAWLMEIVGKGYNRWGNRRSRTTYVILCDKPWKKRNRYIRSWYHSLFPSFPCFFSFGAWEWHHICFHCKATSFDTALLFLPGPPYFSLSRQNLHVPQSSPRQAGQLWHRVLLEPEIVSTICTVIESMHVLDTWLDAVGRSWGSAIFDDSSTCLVLFQCLLCSL